MISEKTHPQLVASFAAQLHKDWVQFDKDLQHFYDRSIGQNLSRFWRVLGSVLVQKKVTPGAGAISSKILQQSAIEWCAWGPNDIRKVRVLQMFTISRESAWQGVINKRTAKWTVYYFPIDVLSSLIQTLCHISNDEHRFYFTMLELLSTCRR